MNSQKFVGIFFNTYTACFLMLLAMQKLSRSAETNYSDHFYLIQRSLENLFWYTDTCFVVSKSNIIKNGIFTQISGQNCTVKKNKITDRYWVLKYNTPQGIKEIVLKGWVPLSPNPKLIYMMNQSFISDVFRNHDDLAGKYAMNKKTIGSLFAKLFFDHYHYVNSSHLNYIDMRDEPNVTRFFFRINSKEEPTPRYGIIHLLKPSTNVLNNLFSLLRLFKNSQ